MGFDELHDATLREVTIFWKERRALLRVCAVGAPPRPMSIVCRDVTSVHAPRHDPWGPSASINEANVVSDASGRRSLRVEMQSGDVIEVVAGSFELELPDVGGPRDGTDGGSEL